MDHSILFVSVKQGGILQSSGFLDLRSLVALGQTCKANALDELSLILLIKNEVLSTDRYLYAHGVGTMEEGINYWRNIYKNTCLRSWLERDHSTGDVIVTLDKIVEATKHYYDVMLVKMLSITPKPELLQLMRSEERDGKTIFQHVAAKGGNLRNFKLLLAHYPESEHLEIVRRPSRDGSTVLHSAVGSGKFEMIQFILDLYPKSEHLQAITSRNSMGWTTLHVAACILRVGLMQFVLSLCPESDTHRQTLNMQDRYGRTALHYATRFGNIDAISTILERYPEPERLQALNVPDRDGKNVLHKAAKRYATEAFYTLLSMCPESERWEALNTQDGNGKTVLDLMEWQETRDLLVESLAPSGTNPNRKSSKEPNGKQERFTCRLS